MLRSSAGLHLLRGNSSYRTLVPIVPTVPVAGAGRGKWLGTYLIVRVAFVTGCAKENASRVTSGRGLFSIVSSRNATGADARTSMPRVRSPFFAPAETAIANDNPITNLFTSDVPAYLKRMVVPTIFRTQRPVELGMTAQPCSRFSTLRNAPVVSPATTCSLITPAGRLAGSTMSMF